MSYHESAILLLVIVHSKLTTGNILYFEWILIFWFNPTSKVIISQIAKSPSKLCCDQAASHPLRTSRGKLIM